MQGTVRALFVAPEKKARPISLDQVRVAADGFEGDYHNRTSNPRQILMISEATLREFDIPPGTLYENIVVDGLDVMKFRSGQRLSIGDAILEVTVSCEPCIQMDRVRRGLKRELDGKRGMFAKVIVTGTIRLGDLIGL